MSKTDCNETNCRLWEGGICTASFEEPNSVGTDNCIKRMRPKIVAADRLSNAVDANLRAAHNGKVPPDVMLELLDAQAEFEKASGE